MRRSGGGGLGLVMALLLGASCEGPGAPGSDSPAPMAPATVRPLVSAGAGPGVRVELAGTAHHVRALQRQPDGTYRSICTDNADALRPAVNRQPGGQR